MANIRIFAGTRLPPFCFRCVVDRPLSTLLWEQLAAWPKSNRVSPWSLELTLMSVLQLRRFYPSRQAQG